MEILYLGRYKQRFKPIIEEVKSLPVGSKVVELCFGDTEIARFCKQNGYFWLGYDINDHFVVRAQKAGFDAKIADLSTFESFPKSDLIVMVGSLYHFHPNTESILSKMFSASNQILISEPVVNLAAAGGIIGTLAKKLSNVGKGDEKFRYNKTSIEDMLHRYCEKYNCKVVSLLPFGKDLIIKLEKK